MLVVDTHALLWWMFEPNRLEKAGLEAIAHAAELAVPSIVFWETSVLVRKAKFEMSMPVADWARKVLAIPRVREMPLTAEIALRADNLQMHSDPADRFIVATTLVHNATLLTKDVLIRGGGIVACVW